MILVIEDDLDIREAFVEILKEAGYEVATASDGQAGLDYLRDPHAERPELILCDLSMPKLGGAEFRRIQLADPTIAGIPCIILTAARPDRALVDQLMPAQFILKPVDFNDFLAAVRQHAQGAKAS